MKNQKLMPILLFSAMLALTAVSGLGLIFIYLPPTIGPRWLFFFFLFLATAALSLPVFALVNQRIEGGNTIRFTPTIRESLEIAFYVSLIVWLKFGRVLDTVTAILILGVIVAIEVLIRVIERSRFKPMDNERVNNEE